MTLRSMMFVPGDSEKKLVHSARTPADALIFDLEDSVIPERKAAARELVSGFLQQRATPSTQSLWVRINALSTADASLDLASVMTGGPDGIVLPKAASADDVVQLAEQLEALEDQNGIARGTTAIMPVCTETPASLFALGGYAVPHPRVSLLTWGGEDLSVALDATTNMDEEGEWLFTYQLARSLCLLAAHAAGALAIDTVFTKLGDGDGLVTQARRARRDGFAGKLAIHPEQVAVINEVFRPTLEEIEDARRVVEAFEASSSAGAIAVDGRMLDLPHLQRARRVIALADEMDERGES